MPLARMGCCVAVMGPFNRAQVGTPQAVVDGPGDADETPCMTRPLTFVAIAAAAVMLTGLTAAPAQAASCGKQAYADGTFGPAVCRDGQANTDVQSAYEKVAPALMALPASATRAQIRAAMCQDRKGNASGEMLFDAVEYQAARYEWSRGLTHRVTRALIAGRYC